MAHPAPTTAAGSNPSAEPVVNAPSLLVALLAAKVAKKLIQVTQQNILPGIVFNGAPPLDHHPHQKSPLHPPLNSPVVRKEFFPPS